MTMAAMAAKAKAMTISAGDATARTAKATKLKGDIMLLQQSIVSEKKAFGVAVYDLMVQGNQAEVDRLLKETRNKIESCVQPVQGPCRAYVGLQLANMPCAGC